MFIFDKNFCVFLIIVAFIIISIFAVLRVPDQELEVNQLLIQPNRGVYLSLTSSLALSPRGGYEADLNQNFQVDVMAVSERTKIDGVDVVIKYDPSILKASGIETVGSVFNVFPLKSIDSDAGEIRFSAIVSPTESFQGEGKVASIVFMGLQRALTDISFVFEPSLNTDTNAAEHAVGRDALRGVKNATILVR